MSVMMHKPIDPRKFFQDARFGKSKGSMWLKEPFCVEVAHKDHLIGVRDSKNPDGPVLAYTEDEWRVFLTGVRNGEFDF